MLDQTSIHNWIVKNKIKTEDGKQLDFFNHLFLFDIAKDFSQKQVIYKCSQVGGSLINVLKTIHVVKFKGYNSIYTLPTFTDAKDFVTGKVNRLVSNNPILQEYTKDRDSVEQKMIGDNLIYFRGTWTEKAAIMIPSDLNVYDEEDRSKLEVIDTYASRLKHSEYKGEWHFSNPSVEGHGVSRYWPRSDQKEWFVICDSCKQEQYLKWPDNVCMERQIFQCRFCKAELSNEARRVGRWVQKYKDREFSGYHISHLMAPWMTAKEIISDYELKPTDYFYNFVLGLPFSGEDSTISPDMIFKNCTDDINPREKIVIGCDSGIKKHYVMGNTEGIFHFGVTESWDDIRKLMKEYEDAILVVDALPDITGPRELRQEFPGRVFLCHYSRDRKTMQLVRWGTAKEAGAVLVDRNRMIQLVVDEFNDRRIPLNGKIRDWDEYYSHWETMYRQEEIDALGMPVHIWESSTGNDHWCLSADTDILTSKGLSKITNVKVGDLVMTRKGYKKVLRSWKTRDNATTFTITLDNGNKLSATGNHKLMVNGEWTTVDSIVYGDIVTVCKEKKSYSMGSNLDVTQTLKQGLRGFTLLQVVHSVLKVLEDYIRRFGRKLMEIFLMVVLFIIRMAIRSTTKLRTLFVLKGKNIKVNTVKKSLKMNHTGINRLSILKRFSRYLTSGERRKQVRNGIQSMLLRLSSYLVLKSLDVLNVMERLKQEVEMEESFVVQDAVVVGMQENGEKESVYNLTVEDEHEYFANGFLVSNCHATIYWRTGMTRVRGGGVAVGSRSFKGIPEAPIINYDQTHELPKLRREPKDWREV